MSNRFDRDEMLSRLAEEQAWDVIVIGGGASGLGAALEAASRGYKTVLLEQSDFAKSTSSKSTKLVHGGVRYLAQGFVGLVREASVERARLLRNAPHVTQNQSFVIPVYNLIERWKYYFGLKAYDWLAGRQSIGASRFVNRKETIRLLPNVKQKSLQGSVVYHDGQFDDARLALNLAQSIADAGGCVVNYVQVKGLLKEGGKVSGVEAMDLESGRTFSLTTNCVLNATGVFADDILRMDDASARRSIRPSQGIHLVMDRRFHPSDVALMIPETRDGRVLFAIPWHNKLILGTTETPVNEASLEPQAQESEVDFILETAGGYLNDKPSRKDILSVFAGLRPLAAPKEGDGKKTKEISRSHRVTVSGSGLLSILGGKWTTYRRMGEDIVDRAEEVMGWPKRRSATAQLKIHGYTETSEGPFAIYGSDASALEKLAVDGEWLSKTIPLHEAQVEWAVRNEMARSVEDVLSRRTRALLLDEEEAVRIAPRVAEIMAAISGKDEDWRREQVKVFTSLAAGYRLK